MPNSKSIVLILFLNIFVLQNMVLFAMINIIDDNAECNIVLKYFCTSEYVSFSIDKYFR